MLATQLFITLILFSIIYLLLLHTKFLNYPVYLCKIALNLHFYFTIAYIICFLFFLVIFAVDWYTSIIAEIIIYIFPYSFYSGIETSDILHQIVDENKNVLFKVT